MVQGLPGFPVLSGAPVVCRSCGKGGLQAILSLGRMPLANALLSQVELDAPEETYPLDLAFCSQCALVQITETVAPEKLFGEYLYFSSFSETMLRHAQQLVERLVVARQLDGRSRVMEIASNDGYLLQYYKMHGVPVLGIEPAANVAEVARRERGIPTLGEFFGEALARRLQEGGRRADVVHAHNVLAHMADLTGVLVGLRLLLKEDGVAVIEVPYVRDMIERCEFDTIYHEHLCYFSLTALERLLRRHDLATQDVEHVPIHGGSLRVFVVSGRKSPTPSVEALLAEEARWGVDRASYYEGFSRRVEELRTALRSLLLELKSQGKSIAAYGAAAKGATLLNYMGFGRDTVSFVVDRSFHKQGRFIPGVRVPIQAPERLLDTMPDYVLLLAWNLAEEIMAQQAEYRRRGGRFIVPVPEVRVI